MNLFPTEIAEELEALQYIYSAYKGGVIEIFYPIVQIRKINSKKEISIKLFYDHESNSFEVQAPTYRYYSKISYYDFKTPEHRWIRNKDVLFSLIKNLKKCGLWNKISNKDFLMVNEYNPKVNFDKLSKMLKAVESG